MSHKVHQSFPCPNCGHTVDNNYCAQCGQPAHLHEETFWGLATHFIAHYFHYEGKFLTTLKTLITQPGRLTTAYWKKERMRYIAPISLYIFVSLVFFSLDYITESFFREIGLSSPQSFTVLPEHKQAISKMSLIEKAVYLIFTSSDANSFIYTKLDASSSKLFLTFLPLLALLLNALFYKRKDLHFGNHAVFSLHFNTMFFIIWLIVVFTPEHLSGYALFVSLSATGLYLMLALRNAYQISILRSVLTSFIVLIGFLMSMLLVMFLATVFFTWKYY